MIRNRKMPFLGWLLVAATVASALVLFLAWHIYESHRFFGHIGTEFIRQTETITEIRALRWELTQAAHHLVLFGQGEDRREAYDDADQRLASVLAAGSHHAGEIPGVASLAGLAGRLGVIERKAMAAAREGRKDEGIGLLHSAEYIEGTRALCAEADGHARAVYSRLQDRLRAHGRSELAFFAIDISVLLFAVGLWWLLGLRLRRWRERAEAELSRRVEAEEQLRRSQKMEALGQMAAGIGHDFKNVLGTIMGYADLASRAAEQGRTDMASLRGIQAAAQQGVAVMGAMLTFSHDTKPEKRPVDLCALLTEATDLLRQTLPSSIRISTRSDVAEDACWILGDRSQLQQVLLNLALNAGDAMPNGGKLSVSLTAGACEAASGVAGDTRPAVCLEVTDTGKGIAPEIRERIFEPFFTTKARGQSTGLGLAIVHAIAMDHGATIDVSSVPGEGATFRLCFRRDAAPAATPAAPLKVGSGLVLIATRDPYEAQLLASAVDRLGIASALIEDWDALTSALKRHAAATVLIDAGFCDLGAEACSRALAATGARPRVLIMAGQKDPDSRAYEDAGFMVLERPLALAEVARLVAGSEASA